MCFKRGKDHSRFCSIVGEQQRLTFKHGEYLNSTIHIYKQNFLFIWSMKINTEKIYVYIVRFYWIDLSPCLTENLDELQQCIISLKQVSFISSQIYLSVKFIWKICMKNHTKLYFSMKRGSLCFEWVLFGLGEDQKRYPYMMSLLPE